MQEINLLQNKVKDRTLQFERTNRLVLITFTLLLILEIAAGVGLYVLTKGTKAQSDQIAADSAKIQAQMDSNQNDLAHAKGLQAQLKNVNSLLSNRVSWQAFLTQMEQITPAQVQLSTISAAAGSTRIHIEAVAPSYADVGRMILSMSTSDKFKNVKLITVGPSQGNSFGYSFSLDFDATSGLFKNQ